MEEHKDYLISMYKEDFFRLLELVKGDNKMEEKIIIDYCKRVLKILEKTNKELEKNLKNTNKIINKQIKLIKSLKNNCFIRREINECDECNEECSYSNEIKGLEKLKGLTKLIEDFNETGNHIPRID